MQLPVLPADPTVPGVTPLPGKAPDLTNEERTAIARELTNAIEGDVRFDVHNRMLYATDASLYQVEPLGVVIPKDIEDAVRAAKFCLEKRLPILPRGGGTSLAGQCTNRAVVIDVSPGCRTILEHDRAAKRVRVEPGITVDDLNDELTKLMPAGVPQSTGPSLFFAPDPATARHASIGGCIGNNAAGSRSIKFGRTAENLIGVDVLLANGERVRFEHGAAARDPRVKDLTRRVLEIALPLATEIRQRFPKTIRRNAGYALDMIVNQALGGGATSPTNAASTQAWDGRITDEMLNRVNLAHLICGSEGTLAMVLGAELSLRDKPGARGLAVLGFDSLDAAIAAVVPILSTNPSAVELLDDLVINLARANREYSKYVELMPQPTGRDLQAVLYVEYFGKDAAEIRERFDALRSLATTTLNSPPMQAHTDAAAMLNAWKLRKAGEPLLHGIPGSRKPITFVEDNAVPVENLSEFVKRFRGIVEKHGTRAAFWAHASVGVLHVRPLLDLHDEADRVHMREIAVEVADLAREMGGVMSGEHGDGRARGPLLERFFGPTIMAAFRDIKTLFDPHNLFNPGNIVPWEGDPRPIATLTQKLRIEPQSKRPVPVPDADTYFDYTEAHGFDGAVEMCNGAGVCRKRQGGTMCPSYMATLDERHSTRGRGNALRLAITGQFAERSESGGGTMLWDDPGTIETLNLCLSCKACKTECPSNVDIAKLKAEYTAQRYKSQPPSVAAKLMGSVRTLNRLGSIAPSVANWMGRSVLGRVIASQLLGIDGRRTLPAFAKSLAKQWNAADVTPRTHTRTETRPATRTVALFGDCFTMFNEPGIGLATKQVLEACGYRVILTSAGCCARAKISLGLLGDAITEIDATIDSLLAIVQQEKIEAILVAEPSCLSAIKDDWLTLKTRSNADAKKQLAALSFLPEEFVAKKWDAHPIKPAFKPLAPGERVILHGHCHQKALWGAGTSSQALQLACGNNVETLDTGCCGMAGSFGYTKDRYDLSMNIGELTLFPAVRKASDAATIAAPGTSCRHQIHDGTGKKALHPIEILASRLAETT